MQVSRESVEYLQELGGGAFGIICKSVCVSLIDLFQFRINVRMQTFTDSAGTVHTAATKTLKSVDAETAEKFLLEAKLLVSIDHPHVVSLYGVHTADTPMMTVMELMGALFIQLKIQFFY